MDILRILNQEKTNAAKNAATIEEKIQKDFMHAFKWGLHAELYEERSKEEILNELLTDMEGQDPAEFLRDFEKKACRWIIRQEPSHSSNQFSNIADAIRYKTQKKIIRLVQDILEIIDMKEGN